MTDDTNVLLRAVTRTRPDLRHNYLARRELAERDAAQLRSSAERADVSPLVKFARVWERP